MNRRVALALVGVLLVACHARAPRWLGASYPPQGMDYGHVVYQATLQEGSRNRRFRLALAFSGGERLRLEVLGPVGGPRAIIASEGLTLQVVFPPQRVFARGLATPAGMEVLLGLPVRPGRFLALLTGSSHVPGIGPAVDGPPESTLQAHYERDSGRLTRADLRLTDAHGVVSLYTVEYLDPGEGPWGVQAQQIRLVHGDRKLTLRVKSAARKPPAPEAFRVRVPERFEEVSLCELPPLVELLFPTEDAP